MSALYWIIGSSVLMSLISLVGAITLVFSETMLKRLLLPLVAMSAGSLIGGAFFHMIPAALEHVFPQDAIWFSLFIGFVVFFVLEQFLHWHHCHQAEADCRQPFTYLILLGDGLHNFIGGLAIASTFLVDIRLGIATWLAAAAHEIPQELGNFGVLVHGGWSKGRALMFNLLASATFLLGGLITVALAQSMDVTFLIAFAAGNFLYIGASDLVPEVNKHYGWKENLYNLIAFVTGFGFMYLIKLIFHQ